MGFQIPHHNKLEPISTNSDSLHKTYPRDMLLDIPFGFDFQSDLNKSYVIRLNKFISEQGTREDILRRCSSFLVSTIVFLGLFYNIWSSLFPLQKQHIHRLSIWPSLLGLFGFLVFVCAVAVMILVRAVFTPMQKAMLIILLVWMHIQSANSILEVCLILLAGLFMAWYAFVKKESPNDESDVKSSNMLMSCQLKQ
ncbi:unnamed protein product [Lathyrus sativus]|nr:unnamed protein product [Lathyrus sativus]